MAVIAEKIFELKNGRKVTVRNGRPEDAEIYPEFQQQIARETQFTNQRPEDSPSIESIREKWQKFQDDPKELRLVALVEGKLIGQLGMHNTSNHPWMEHLAFFGVMVLQKHWGTGVAEILLKEMHTHAKRVGIWRIEGMVRTKNARGMAFYKRMGYEIEGTRRKAAMIDGEAQDEWYISVLL